MKDMRQKAERVMTGKKNADEESVKESGAAAQDMEPARETEPIQETASARDAAQMTEDELEKLKAKAEEYYGQLQRLQADFDNYRKRTQKEKADLILFATERLIRDLLPVLDNMERAVEAAGKNQDFAAFSQGVDMIFRQVREVLGKEGLKPMEVVGRPFDPNLHEAVLRVDSEEHEENVIVEEVQKGYFLKEKVLRPGMVAVSN